MWFFSRPYVTSLFNYEPMTSYIIFMVRKDYEIYVEDPFKLQWKRCVPDMMS